MKPDAFNPLNVEPICRLSYRPNEAAESLGISQRTLSDWMKLPNFPLVKIKGCCLIPVNDLQTWLSSQITAAEGEKQNVNA